MGKRLSNYLEKTIIRLYTKKKKDPTEIGNGLGIDRNTVRAVLKRNNIPLRGNRSILNKAPYIISEYNKGRDAKDIATELGTYNTSVRRVLLRHNIPLRNQSDVQRKLHENPFSDLSDPDVQYWLGMIAADGNVAKDRAYIRLNCGKNDEEHLNKYARWLGHGVNVTMSKSSGYDTPEYCVAFTLKAAKNTLIQIGIVPKKSTSIKMKMPLTWNFVRGVFDGDGTISCCGSHTPIVSIATASFEFLSQLSQFFANQGILSSVKRQSSVYIVSIRAKSFNDFRFKLYDGAQTFLERKAKKFGFNVSDNQ